MKMLSRIWVFGKLHVTSFHLDQSNVKIIFNIRLLENGGIGIIFDFYL